MTYYVVHGDICVEPESRRYLLDTRDEIGTECTRVKWVMTRELGHVYGVPVRGVVDGEDEVNHRLFGRRVSILFKDSRTVCEGVSDWGVEFGDDRF